MDFSRKETLFNTNKIFNMSFSIITVTFIAFSFVLFTTNNAALGDEQFLTPQAVKDFNAKYGINEAAFTPTGSAFQNANPDIRNGLLAYAAVMFQLFDDYIANAILFNLPYDVLNTPGVNKIGAIKLLQDIIVFVNATDFTFVHAGLENNVITCLKALRA